MSDVINVIAPKYTIEEATPIVKVLNDLYDLSEAAELIRVAMQVWDKIKDDETALAFLNQYSDKQYTDDDDFWSDDFDVGGFYAAVKLVGSNSYCGTLEVPDEVIESDLVREYFSNNVDEFLDMLEGDSLDWDTVVESYKENYGSDFSDTLDKFDLSTYN